MLDPNVTTLLSTLLGGSLAITGSIVANFYINRTQLRENKRKELQQIVERIYKDILSIEEQIKTVPYKKTDADEIWNEIIHNLTDIISVYHLYIPYEFDSKFSSYIDAINGTKTYLIK